MADLVTLDEVLAHLNMSAPPPDVAELDLFIDAATAHVEHHYGAFPATEYVEDVAVVDDLSGVHRLWVRPRHTPIVSVASAIDENGTEYTTGFVISTDSRQVRHDSITTGTWTLTYTAGEAAPADLKLAALEDIRGLYQPGQIGPPANFGAFDIPDTPTFRPVNLWPRLDAWIYSRTGPAIA